MSKSAVVNIRDDYGPQNTFAQLSEGYLYINASLDVTNVIRYNLLSASGANWMTGRLLIDTAAVVVDFKASGTSIFTIDGANTRVDVFGGMKVKELGTGTFEVVGSSDQSLFKVTPTATTCNAFSVLDAAALPVFDVNPTTRATVVDGSFYVQIFSTDTLTVDTYTGITSTANIFTL